MDEAIASISYDNAREVLRMAAERLLAAVAAGDGSSETDPALPSADGE